jgi:hypothetical protein
MIYPIESSALLNRCEASGYFELASVVATSQQHHSCVLESQAYRIIENFQVVSLLVNDLALVDIGFEHIIVHYIIWVQSAVQSCQRGQAYIGKKRLEIVALA